MDSKILDVTWFTGIFGTIGIIATDNGHERKFYIGIGLGRSEDEDTKLIAEEGSPVDGDELIRFLARNMKRRETI